MSRLRVLPFCLCLLLTGCRALVPIIGWSNSDAFSSVHESEFRSANDFLYSASLDNIQMIIIFKSPELTFDQLARYGGLYGNQESSLLALQNELEISKSSVWAGSDGRVTSDLLETLSFLLETKPYVISGNKEVTEMHKLVLVELPTGKGEDGLIQQDKLIGEVMGSVGDLPGSPSYAAIFTSDDKLVPVRQKFSFSSEHRVKRDASSNSDDGLGSDLVNSEGAQCAKVVDGEGKVCLLFCLQPLINVSLDISVSQVISDDFKFNSSLTDVEFVGGDCDTNNGDCNEYGGGTCMLVEASGDGVPQTEFAFVFERGYCKGFVNTSTTDKVACGFYTMKVFINGERYQRHREGKYLYSNLTIPKDTAYACGDNGENNFYSFPSNFSDLAYSKDSKDSSELVSVYHFNSLQVQAFGGFQVDKIKKETVFGSTYNCQGYISSESLMGVVSIVILSIILYCGVVFMFSINTLDRFDDPRGPTITIENLH